MRILLVVVLEGDGQVTPGDCHVRLGHVDHIVPLHRFDQAFRHAVALRAARRCGPWRQAKDPHKVSGGVGGVSRAVVTQPFNCRRFTLQPDALFQALQHHALYVVATVTRRAGHPAHHFAIAAVHDEGDTEFVVIVTADFKPVRAPAGIAAGDGDPPIVATGGRAVFAGAPAIDCAVSSPGTRTWR